MLVVARFPACWLQTECGHQLHSYRRAFQSNGVRRHPRQVPPAHVLHTDQAVLPGQGRSMAMA